MRPSFEKELQYSMYAHYPLPLHKEMSLEASFARKTVIDRLPIWDDVHRSHVVCVGVGEMNANSRIIVLTAPLKRDVWPEGATDDGDYCNYGEARIRFPLEGKDLTQYNRIHFWVKPQVNGAHVTFLCGGMKNEGEIPIPDPYFREGNTVWDLKPNEWNECFWEFTSMPRDCITELDFYVYLSGGDAGTEKKIRYEFKDIAFENVAAPEVERGWICGQNRIVCSTEGYWRIGKKIAIANTTAENFSVLQSRTGKEVFRGEVKSILNRRGNFQVLDFTALKEEGEYYLSLNGARSKPFVISDTPCEESLWRAVNFLNCERCGTVVPTRHGVCHLDITAEHNGEVISYAGGWHDAGDVSQQTAQTAEVACALAEAASRCAAASPLHRRLAEEAIWGLEFVLRTRFGDGYRATSAGATRWTDNRYGNFDDIHARVYNHAYENFLFAGIEAACAEYLRADDEPFAWSLQNAAEQDFAFAQEKFAQTRVHAEQMFEHTYNSGLSQYYACISWAASCLFRATKDEKYADAAREYGDKMLACQETGKKIEKQYAGFFYRDRTHKTVVHYNHQAREHQFAQALYELCETQPGARQYAKWMKAARLYGDYLKNISRHTAPYGMMPAGIHRYDEANDAKTFRWLHITADYETEKENYQKQLSGAYKIDDKHALRVFPVWFSFRGNNAVLLSMGKSASLMGKLLNDKALTEIAREQLYWIWGKNPFGQSLMYGSGSNYCSQYAVLCGETVGAIPVGIETRNNEDVPYWPQNNNATFREVWTTSVGHFVRLAADLIEDENQKMRQEKNNAYYCY